MVNDWVKRRGGGEGVPIKSLWADRLKFVSLFPPSSPAGVLETRTVSNRVLLPCHAFPRAPDVLLAPLV